MKLAELAAKVGGELVGDGGIEIRGLASAEDAGPGDVTFLSNPRYEAAVAGTRASAVIVNASWAGACPCARICVPNADRAFALAATCLGPAPVRYEPGVHPSAVVAADARLGEGVSVGPCCVVARGASVGARTVLVAGCYVGEGVEIGEDGLLYPNVVVREGTRIGKRAILHPGAAIGNDGFGYVKEGAAWIKVPQVGGVELGDDVEIGANATVDRARFGKTVIGHGVKIDNLVQVAHNVRIGDHSAMAAQVGISGSTRIGRGVQLGGQAGLAGHLDIGDGAIVGAQAGVTKNVAAAAFVSGYPAMPHAEARRMHAHLMRLPETKKRLEAAEARIERLERVMTANGKGDAQA